MIIEKGLITLSLFDLEWALKCPGSLINDDRVKNVSKCHRCFALGQVAKYCLSRSFRQTNSPSIKTLTSQYDYILSNELDNKGQVQTIIRKDLGILNDLIDLSKSLQSSIDLVNPELVLNFGSFIIKDHIDAILFQNGRYSIFKIICDDHDLNNYNYLSYEIIGSSLWLRNNYKIINNDIFLIQLRKSDLPIFKYINLNVLTQKLEDSVSDILKTLSSINGINTEKKFNEFKHGKPSGLPLQFGTHCHSCRLCLD